MFWLYKRKRISEDSVDIHIKRQAWNTKLQLVCNSLSLNTTDSHHQFKLYLATSLLLSVQTVWGRLRSSCLQETVLSPQGVLMKVSNDAFTDYEEWMVILYDDNILMCGNTMDVAYEALKEVLQRVHNLSIVLKMLRTWWLGFRPVQFFCRKIMGTKIYLTQDRKDDTQAINFLEK